MSSILGWPSYVITEVETHNNLEFCMFSWQVVVLPPVVSTAATPSASPTSAAAPLATSWWARDTVSLHWTELSHLMISETLQSSLFAISIRLAVTKT